VCADVCVSAGKARLVAGISSVPPLDMACCLASLDWHCVLSQPVASEVYLLQLMPARLTALKLLIKVSATVTVYRGHRQTRH